MVRTTRCSSEPLEISGFWASSFSSFASSSSVSPGTLHHPSTISAESGSTSPAERKQTGVPQDQPSNSTRSTRTRIWSAGLWSAAGWTLHNFSRPCAKHHLSDPRSSKASEKLPLASSACTVTFTRHHLDLLLADLTSSLQSKLQSQLTSCASPGSAVTSSSGFTFSHAPESMAIQGSSTVLVASISPSTFKWLSPRLLALDSPSSPPRSYRWPELHRSRYRSPSSEGRRPCVHL